MYTALETIKHSGIYSAKKVKCLYTEHYETVTKEMEENTNKHKDIWCSWNWKYSIVKMSIPPKSIYRLNAISKIISMVFYTQIKKKSWNV